MEILKFIGIFVLFFLIVYVVYYFFTVRPQLKLLDEKSKEKEKKAKKNSKKKDEKKKELPAEVLLLKNYYGVNIDKVGIRRVFKILNTVNAFFLSILVLIVLPFKQPWLKILLLAILILPATWGVYYLIAKYLKHLEGKSEKDV